MIMPVVGAAELFHDDGRTDGWRDGETDVTKVRVAFRYCAIAHKKTQTHTHQLAKFPV
jgi:hypothetical protein